LQALSHNPGVSLSPKLRWRAIQTGVALATFFYPEPDGESLTRVGRL
jgi:hypothetical protein